MWQRRQGKPKEYEFLIFFYFEESFYKNPFVYFQTQIIYKWIEPKICLEGVPGAQPLPSSGEREPCPPCNPGFYNNDTATCSPCPPGTYSDGMKRNKLRTDEAHSRS